MDFMISKLLGFFLVLIRLSAFFLVAPIFRSRTIPARAKIGLTVMLSIFFAGLMPSYNASKISSPEALLLLFNEALYGFALGLVAILLFSAVKACGRIIERQMGLALAQTFNPLTGERGQPLGMVLETIFILLFLSADGHHMFLMAIDKSFQLFPIGEIPSLSMMTEGVVRAGSFMLLAGLRLAAPILTAFILLLAMLGVCARMLPDMNILFISLPFRVGMGLLMTAVFIPFLSGFVKEFTQWMDKLLPI